ncbi:MAG: hypothetical protein V7608_4432 [Hyphomicrobiales bacterium]
MHSEFAAMVRDASLCDAPHHEVFETPTSGRLLRMRVEFDCSQGDGESYSITSTATFLPRSVAVEPIAKTNGIDSTQIAVSSMKSFA